MGLARFFWWG